VHRAHHSTTTVRSGKGNSLHTSIAVRKPGKGIQMQRELLILDPKGHVLMQVPSR
jgi:hypothetical protein